MLQRVEGLPCASVTLRDSSSFLVFKTLRVGGGRREMTAKTHFNVRD